MRADDPWLISDEEFEEAKAVLIEKHGGIPPSLQRPGVPVEDILRIERQACGHSDYVAQWAIRCADRVLRGSDGLA